MTPKAASIKAESLDRDGLKSKIVPSSPLIGNGKVVSDTDPLIPLLKKYNATFDNLDSQTPIPQKHARSSSDSESIDVGNEQISPSFARTRSEGLQVDHATYNKLSLNKKKLLKSGISRFRRPSSSKKNSSKAASPALTNLNDMVKNNNSLSACTSAPSSASSSRDINKLLDAIGNSFRLQSPDIPGSVADQIYDENKNNSKGQETSNSSDSDFSSDLGDLSELIEKKTISQLNRKPPVNELIKDNSKDDDFDDDKFSDEIDMVELDTFFKKKSQNESTAMKGETKKEKIPTTLKKLEDEFGDHAFSSDNSTEDDDEELCQIMNKLSQKKSIAAKKSPADSETLLARSDRNNVAIFQTGVKRFDTPDYLKSFKDNKTEQKNLAKSALQKPNCHRYQVLDVLKAKYTKNNRTKEQLIITVMKPDNSVDKVLVRDLWATLEIAKNDVIHIIGSNPKIVDNDNNLLIWNPDIMISATNTGQALDCSRKSVLNSKLAFPGDSSVPLIVGNIVHSLFQECLSKNNTSLEFINESLENLLQSNLIDILSINETLQRIKDEVNMHIPYIQNWYSTFINDDARAIIVTEGQKEKSNMSISNILDVEENIWSPMFGIRGLIDVTVEAHLKNSNYDGKFVTPLEIKTGGREYLNHRAQTSLYTLLINERYDMDRYEKT
ncbi:hypothetical protein PACTADRAFT_184923 [Pachysolen tannophilus NRRL Y-2460]|uniref:DNA replication factor Dna2 N-terminal domain-containing protein n=1 Tax=Pachysolen tannophilus NRRL Y-2460 TaxID=669874 RepID=A0A1E4U3B6_PACTA|nr:hypothetical protein PACTADRAFT_184923 [Pachysolen tannophilus NRRL Y-2460]